MIAGVVVTVIKLLKMVGDILHYLRVNRWDVYPVALHFWETMHYSYGDVL